MTNLFMKHPNSLGETYFQHMSYALKFGFKMLWGGLTCIIHAIFPFLFMKSASSVALTVLEDMVDRSPVLEERLVMLGRTISNKMKTVDITVVE